MKKIAKHFTILYLILTLPFKISKGQKRRVLKKIKNYLSKTRKTF